MSIQSDIYEAFFKALEAGSLGFEISNPNVEFSEPPPYIAIAPLPAKTVSLGINSGNLINGIMQFAVVYKTGEGIIVPAQTADAIIALFPRPSTLQEGSTYVRIISKGWQAPPVQGADTVQIPVSIPFQVHN